ncbi:DUF4286 family protein [Variovorax sp. KK3]|uniref:DUF4286 family protein n=1 Tax=Variovorax sp. KK3 TaxID=1855728 RepID=UPI00097C430C|nr:DUF4286 family protein [Variovorax sp. KK3]
MLAATEGAMLIWNNIDPSAEGEFNDWYNRQHLFERSCIQGVLRARRFRMLEGTRRYFVTYEARSAAVFGQEEYLHSVNNPLARTQAIVGRFSDTVRTIHTVVERHGDDGGFVATLRINAGAAEREACGRAIRDLSAKRLALRPNLVGATVFEEDASVSSLPNTEKDIRASRDERCDWVIFLEAIDASALGGVALELAEQLPPPVHVEIGIYQHIVTKYHGSSRDF